jgi:hypothetical protein
MMGYGNDGFTRLPLQGTSGQGGRKIINMVFFAFGAHYFMTPSFHKGNEKLIL